MTANIVFSCVRSSSGVLRRPASLQWTEFASLLRALVAGQKKNAAKTPRRSIIQLTPWEENVNPVRAPFCPWREGCFGGVWRAPPFRALARAKDTKMNELYVICRAVQIEDGQVSGFTLMRAEPTGEPKPWRIMITRKGANVYGYENVCPHQGERLDGNSPGNFLDEDGNFIACSVHGAMFDLDSGECFIGPCKGKNLSQIQLVVDEGDVCVTGVELAED
jgi:nitrite reductase/ring-hydroxylating ferredoxin subunit